MNEAGKMNHGVVMFHGKDQPDSRIWRMAMDHGQFIALYTDRRMEQAADGFPSEFWLSALAPSTGVPPTFLAFPDLGGNPTEYGRYEPSDDGQFLEMCRRCTRYSGAPTVVLPANASDEEAMRLLVELRSIEERAMTYLYDRFYVVPRQNLRKPEKSQIQLPRLVSSIGLKEDWAYFLGFFQAGLGVVVFLSDDASYVEGIFKISETSRPVPSQADWLHEHHVIEKW
jgi:hypothetical protein